jgi:hypothetical protein
MLETLGIVIWSWPYRENVPDKIIMYVCLFRKNTELFLITCCASLLMTFRWLPCFMCFKVFVTLWSKKHIWILFVAISSKQERTCYILITSNTISTESYFHKGAKQEQIYAIFMIISTHDYCSLC